MKTAREAIAQQFAGAFADEKFSANRADEIIAALSAAGLAIVPAEPTEAQILAAITSVHDSLVWSSTAASVYRAMIAAAKEG